MKKKEREKNTKLPKISIIIPSYNKGKYLEATLQSITEQRYPNYEVIIQDGGSTDNSVKIIKKFASKYSDKVTWISERDDGQLDAINKGMEKARGDLIAYINADDIYTPGAFHRVAKYHRGNPDCLWFVGYGDVIDDNGIRTAFLASFYKRVLLLINSYPMLLIVNYIMQPSVFLSTDAYKKYGPFSGTKRYVLEYDLWLSLGKISMPTPIPFVLSRFRLSLGSISTTQTSSLLADDEAVVEQYTTNQLILLLHKLHNQIRRNYI